MITGPVCDEFSDCPFCISSISLMKSLIRVDWFHSLMQKCLTVLCSDSCKKVKLYCSTKCSFLRIKTANSSCQIMFLFWFCFNRLYLNIKFRRFSKNVSHIITVRAQFQFSDMDVFVPRVNSVTIIRNDHRF